MDFGKIHEYPELMIEEWFQFFWYNNFPDASRLLFVGNHGQYLNHYNLSRE
jgi:hypothetical protein